MSASTLLTEVEAAISKALTAQSYTQRQREVVRARLKELFEARTLLKNEIEAESTSGGSMASVGEIITPK